MSTVSTSYTYIIIRINHHLLGFIFTNILVSTFAFLVLLLPYRCSLPTRHEQLGETRPSSGLS